MRKTVVTKPLPARAVSSVQRNTTPPLSLFDYSSRWPTSQSCRKLANVRDNREILQPLPFPSFLNTVEFPGAPSNGDGKQPANDRTLRLGKTVQTLQDRMPTLLASPLPQDILSPKITLHLFPSTHPHLPTVSGRISYTAALWTAPVAWGRVPVVGNVHLKILSERMIKSSQCAAWGSAPYSHAVPPAEKLIVRWKTCGKTMGRGMGAFYRGIGGSGDQVDKITEFLGGDARDDEEFTGLFVFEFDEEGRLCKHTIEHVQQSGNWEKMTRVVSVTDWLLGLAKGKGRPGSEIALGVCTARADRRGDRLDRLRQNGG